MFAAAIAVAAWAGLTINVVDSFGRLGSIGATIWLLVNFFTITTNLLVAVMFTRLAARRQALATARPLAGLTVSILLVGIIYQLLLNGLYHLSPLGKLGDVLLHRVTPILVPLFWLTFVPKGRLAWRDPLLWAIYPLGYLVFAIARGLLSGFYPYPFMDLGRIGWLRLAINALVIGAGFIATGLALVWLDHMLGRRERL